MVTELLPNAAGELNTDKIEESISKKFTYKLKNNDVASNLGAVIFLQDPNEVNGTKKIYQAAYKSFSPTG